MTISFTPALGELVRIAVKHDASSVRLRFTAVVFVHEYRYYERSGAQLQIWSDIPTAGAASDGWGARNFEGSEGQSRRSSSSSASDEMDFDQVVLSLVVNAPLKTTTRSYSFTYRILYPGGEVSWLGTASTNGEFVFRRHSRPRVGLDSGKPQMSVSFFTSFTTILSLQLNESFRRLQASLYDEPCAPLRVREKQCAAQPLSLSELGESELPTIQEEAQADAHLGKQRDRHVSG
ncbi:hypothetical protein BDZ89DRAFT_1079364 [Hymenopellis radicata]|nr:hypothetical protein BDZ89DRAFT_1079364 [Hymenopellis radicata]